MKKLDISKVSQELADKLSKLDTPEKARDEIQARIAEVRARFEAKRKNKKEGIDKGSIPSL